MGKEMRILAFSLLVCLCFCEKGAEAVKKELTGSKRITLQEYRKLSEKERMTIFNELEMSNRFELLKAVLPGQSCGTAPDADLLFETNGKLIVRIPEGNFVNKWKIDSKGMTVYNVKKLERLENYLGANESNFNQVFWNSVGELFFVERLDTDGTLLGLVLFCGAGQLQ
ncbi:hypothetical protein QMM42_16650 [Leptospira santarosai]|uniref:hypothetical protein n=2 Tax=Leptospira santarosai TaxID=28183 RepID=UPI0024AEA164|nr:hypothetical protein [Leptospira santarosai]MDI7187809.1 hypothetical protein [Leptospira santarosai]MDI7201675.1 hypothetical protein [Leptospira santarosai]